MGHRAGGHHACSLPHAARGPILGRRRALHLGQIWPCTKLGASDHLHLGHGDPLTPHSCLALSAKSPQDEKEEPALAGASCLPSQPTPTLPTSRPREETPACRVGIEVGVRLELGICWCVLLQQGGLAGAPSQAVLAQGHLALAEVSAGTEAAVLGAGAGAAEEQGLLLQEALPARPGKRWVQVVHPGLSAVAGHLQPGWHRGQPPLSPGQGAGCPRTTPAPTSPSSHLLRGGKESGGECGQG